VTAPIHQRSVAEIRRFVASREVSCAEVVRSALDAADAAAPLGAFLQVLRDEALARANALDAALAHDPTAKDLPLLGVPIAVKDNLCTREGRTTAGSRLLEGYRSPFTATAVARLEAAGAIVVGKTNMDEFGMGSSGENSAFGPTRNPWDPARVPGGSSSGSAAAVAAGVVPLALGSDTGGSIRQPASHCGVVGLKPTYGRVSRYGLVAYASSLDQVGPMSRRVADAAAALAVMAGHDPHDATSRTRTLDPIDPAEPLAGLRVGVPAQARAGANDPAVAAAFEASLTALRGLGATIHDVAMPHLDHAIASYYIVATAEASSNLARYDGVRYGRRAALAPGEGLLDLYKKSRSEGLGAEVKRRIMLGTHVLSSGYYDAYYTTAMKVRRLIKGDFDAAFASGCHVILTPASPGPAFRLGEKTTDPLAMYLEDVYTVPINLAGLPAIVVPVGSASVGKRTLPIGMQLIAPPFAEGTLLRAARMLESVSGWAGRIAPPLSTPA
jgi:aspartyl-tRNA(Asn)/glutamyl-tRNA(Gln) amidotransferase subunit A